MCVCVCAHARVYVCMYRTWNNNLKLVGHSLKQEYCNRLSMASPLKMYSKFGLANWLYLARWWKFVGKWPMAGCYFKFCIYDFITACITWFSEINFKVLNHLEEIKLLWKQRWSAKSHNLIAGALVWHLYTSLAQHFVHLRPSI